MFKNIFGKKEKKDPLKKYAFSLTDEEKKAIRDFLNLDVDNRIRKIMFLGDSGDLRNFALIRFAIQKDPDIHVKFAGLKRIHLFKGHPEFKEMITDLQKDGKGEKMEPYFSMALSKLGIISIEEFERRIKSG